MRRTLLLGIVLTLAACDRDGGPVSPSPSSISGSYTLATVDGQALPFVVTAFGGYQASLVSGTLVLKGDGTYSLAIDHRVDDSGNIRTGTDGDVGLWTVNGAALGLTSTQGGIARTGTVDGNVITLQSSIRVFVLRK